MTQTIKHLLGYPKFFALILSCALAYMLFSTGVLEMFGESLNGYGYFSIFIAGLLFSFGFTAPFAVGILLAMAHNIDPYLGALIGGFGAFLSDVFIFEFVRFSFHDEIHHFRSTRMFQVLHALVHHERVPAIVRMYLLWSFAGIIIASPFPDELGITLISSVTSLDTRRFGVLCFVLNVIGILIILEIGKLAIG